MNIFVYILQCADGSYYVGTHRGDTIEARVGEHNAGLRPDAYTYSRRPVVLEWCEAFTEAQPAIELEQRLKKWSRAKKEAFMCGDWERLKSLARSRTAPADPAKSRFRRLTGGGEAD